MRKTTAVLLLLTICLPMLACSAEAMEQTPPAADAVWLSAEDNAITDELRAELVKTFGRMKGVSYTPVACLAERGSDRAVLCTAQAVVPHARPYYAIVFLEGERGVRVVTMSLDGSVSENVGGTEPLLGGWNVAQSQEEGLEAFEKALADGDESYTPICVLSNQVVAGMNYCVLCRPAPETEGAHCTLLYLYEDLSGRVWIKHTADLDIGSLAAEEE